jgi:hypothetical protein
MKRLTTLLVALLAPVTASQAQIAVKNQGYIPYSDAPINYRSEDISDAVTVLQKKLDTGGARLVYREGDHGYLKSVLQLLDIPVSSQTLVFSKTSFQYPKISPRHPRALYFNDDIYIGAVHEGKEIEVVSFDRQQGAMFFILHEQKAETPRFDRAELDCTQCHIAAATRGVPGVMLRSVQPHDTGTPVAGTKNFISDQESPLNERWGGWYVTGPLARKTLANLAAPADATSRSLALDALPETFDPKAFLAPGSDDVALLVLGHQTQMHNLITLTNYRTRIALHDAGLKAGDDVPEDLRQRFEKPAEQLLRYLLFINETRLPDLDGAQMIGGSAYAREFAERGPFDSKGRSLRQFDLNTRIFKYPCSYLIYSDAFDALPEPAKGYVYRRLLEVLSGQDQGPDFAALPAGARGEILEILLQTKRGLPREWTDYARANQLRVADRTTPPKRSNKSR